MSNTPDGTYRLTVDLDNPRLDKRCSRDWTRQHFNAGTVYHVQTWPSLSPDSAPERTYREIRRPFEYISITNGRTQIELFDLLCAHFEPLEETPVRYLSRIQASNRADEILDHLVETGQLTLHQVKQALEEIDRPDK
jgi:hypothetical protein